jgi:L-malate glycosyltransferase
MVQLRILHICSYYIRNKLYSELFEQLSKDGIHQEIFIPIKSKGLVGKNEISPKVGQVNFYYKNILNRTDRFLFNKKTNKQFMELQNSINIKGNIDFIHAHTVFSDGATAYKLNRKYGLKYIVNVRNTDINVFWKLGLHLRKLMFNILSEAENIIFLSPAYMKKTLSLLPQEIVTKIQKKCIVIPNGINDYWHSTTLPMQKKISKEKISLLFIGTVDKNKNLETVLKVCAKLRNDNLNVSLNVLGDGPLLNKYKKLSEDIGIKDFVEFIGYVNDKDKILNVIDESHIFVMPSFKETFGLVYIEAMSRGLPVIYSKGEGIDGIFNEGEVGYAVNPYHVESITQSIKDIYGAYGEVSNRCVINAREFNWESISKKYLSVYSGSSNKEIVK